MENTLNINLYKYYEGVDEYLSYLKCGQSIWSARKNCMGGRIAAKSPILKKLQGKYLTHKIHHIACKNKTFRYSHTPM